MIKQCENPECKNTFEAEKRGGYEKRFCSTYCRQRYWSLQGKKEADKTIETRTCANPFCNNTFEVREVSRKKYCSRKCRDAARVFKEEPISRTEETIEREKEKLRNEITRKELIQLLREKSKLDLVIESLQEAIVPIDVKPSKFVSQKTKKDEEIAVLVLSDLHIGKKTKSYDSEVFVKRLNNLSHNINTVIDILRQTYPINKLVIFALGDFVDHVSIYKTHAWHVDQHTMNQIYRTGVPALCQFLLDMSNNFESVDFVGVRGNHGRSGKFLPEELNFDLILYETLKLACQNMSNLTFHIDWDWYSIHKVWDYKFLLTHGDVIRMWLNIPIYGQTQKGMRWQGSIGQFDYLVMGHFHTCVSYTWNNFEVLSNGTFTTDDDYTTQVLGLSSETCQLLFGMHPKEGKTWQYKIKLEK